MSYTLKQTQTYIIVKAAVEMSSHKSTTLIGDDTDLLVLLLYHAASDCKDLYFRSDKDKLKPYVYNIKVLKKLLGDDVCSNLMFAHAFSGCDSTSGIYIWHREEVSLQKRSQWRSCLSQFSKDILCTKR